MGDKAKAREIVAERGLPVTPGSPGELKSEQDALEAAANIGYPGHYQSVGRRRRTRHAGREQAPKNLARAFQAAQAEAKSPSAMTASISNDIFSSPAISKCRLWPIIAAMSCISASGTARSSGGTKSCVEETPSPAVDEKLRREIGRVAVEAVKAVHYRNVGTVEFLLDKDHNFFFMEVNTRIQVEHPITEMVTGIDLIKEQIRLADGHAALIQAARHQAQRAQPRMPDQRRRSGKVHAMPGHDHQIQRPGRIRRSGRFGDGIECHRWSSRTTIR